MGWGGTPWIWTPFRLQVGLFCGRFWALFLAFPKQGVMHGPDAAHGVRRPWRGPRDLGTALGAWEGRMRGVGGAGNGPAAGEAIGGGCDDDQLQTTDVAYSKPLLYKIVHTM